MSTPLEAGSSAEVRAHAKINLRHRVFGRDDTGFHSVETLLARTSLVDSLTLEEAGEGVVVEVNGPLASGVPEGSDNLCWRAADLFLERAFPRAAKRPGVRIELAKRIPIGAGLGGGSADAGAVLRLLAARWDRLSEGDLLSIAGELGSDVAFAVLGVPMALGWERGRRLLPLRAPSPRPALLVCPAIHVSTADAYRWISESDRDEPRASVLPGPARLGQWPALESVARNDFEIPVTARHPELSTLLDLLRALDPPIAAMTGSGSTVFGIFRAEADRDEARRVLSEGVSDDMVVPQLIDVDVPI